MGYGLIRCALPITNRDGTAMLGNGRSALAHDKGCYLAVDNCFCTPALQRPALLGADIVTHSGTKYLDGQGRVVAGAVCASSEVVQGKLVPVMRSAGMSLSPFNAWVVLKGLETLELRAHKQADNALEVARALEGRVARMLHPGLPSHPQHELVKRQMDKAGSVFAFEVDFAWVLFRVFQLA